MTQNSYKIISTIAKDPKVLYEMMKVKDKDGESMFTHLIETKQYDLL